MGRILPAFFGNEELVWLTGGLLLFGGLLIVAFHHYWTSPAAGAIFLFGWFLVLRGLVLLAAPQLIWRVATASVGAIPVLGIGFGAVLLVGVWLTYRGWEPLALAAGGRTRGE